MAINKSWREQRKEVVAVDDNGNKTSYISLWQAALAMAQNNGCKHETAKKEISRAIKSGLRRYGFRWSWKGEI